MPLQCRHSLLALVLLACLACGPGPAPPARAPGDLGLVPRGPVFHSILDPSFVGMLPGPDGFVGTYDDLPLAGANPEGTATHTTTLGTTLGDVTTFLHGTTTLPRPISLFAGALPTVFSVEARSNPTFGLPGDFFSVGAPSVSGSTEGSSQALSLTLGACFDGTGCDPEAKPLDLELDLAFGGVTLARGYDLSALVGLDPAALAYLEQLTATVPADWTAIQLVRSEPRVLTADETRGLFAHVFIGATSSGVTAQFTSDPFRVGLAYLGLAAASGDGFLASHAGDLHALGLAFGTPYAPVAPDPMGTFSFASAGADDFRLTPGTVELQVPSGEVHASVARANAARRLDPASGRPLRGDAVSGATCPTGGEADCWTPGDPFAQNAALFDAICAWNRGFTALDPSACAADLFNSQTLASGFKIANVFGVILSGDPQGVGFASALVAMLTGVSIKAADLPLVDLGLADRTGDGLPDDPANDGPPFSFFPSLDRHLPSAAQRGLLGCGPFVGDGAVHACHESGLSLFDAEVSALVSAWFTQPGFDPTSLAGPMPGTEAFVAVNDTDACRRPASGGEAVLPGCRRPCRADSPNQFGGDVFPGCTHPIYEGYDAATDGDPSAIGTNEFALGSTTLYECPIAGDLGWCDTGHPFTGERWSSVMDAFSWNLQIVLALLSTLGAAAVDVDGDGFADFDVGQFQALDPIRADGCSLRRPDLCASVDAFWGLTVALHPGGPEGPPLRRWVWESGAEYHVDSASDGLARYAGGVLHASGPGVGSLRVPMLLLEDRDVDGATDEADNCWGVANANQADADGNGIGNACDCDFDGDTVCNVDDFSVFLADFLAGTSAEGRTDMTGDGAVNVDDFALFLPGFVEGKPGPSGLVSGPGQTFTGQVRKRHGIPADQLGFVYGLLSEDPGR